MSYSEYKEASLYEGLILTELPSTFQDIRSHSFVPDNEEIYNDILLDSKLIVEIMELPNQESEQNIIKFYFDDLSEANESIESQIIEQKDMQQADLPNIRYAFT